MANIEDVLIIKEKIKNSSIDMNKGMIGTLTVLNFLYNSDKEVTSKELSDKLKVSSARMTILLQKLEKDNIITKEQSKKDARAVNVKLTKYGIIKSEEIKESFHLSIEKLLDMFGLEELINLLQKMDIIRNVLKENLIIDLKEENK